MKYVIDKKTYDSHINDEVHLYGLLHQLAFMAKRVETDEDMENVLEAAMNYGELADAMYARWEIPGRYLVYREKKDLAGLYEKELTLLTRVLKEHDAEMMEKAVAASSWETTYLIHGGTFRLLVGNIFELLARYGSLCRRVEELKTDKDLERLKKQIEKTDRRLLRMFKAWGVDEEKGVTCRDVLEEYIIKKHLIPVSEGSPKDEPNEELSPEDFFEDPEEADLFYGIEEPDSDDLLFFGIEDGDD